MHVVPRSPGNTVRDNELSSQPTASERVHDTPTPPHHGQPHRLRATQGVSGGRPRTTPKALRADSAEERPFSKYFLSRFGWRQSQPVRGLGEQGKPAKSRLRTAFVKKTQGAGLAHTQAAKGQAHPPLPGFKPGYPLWPGVLGPGRPQKTAHSPLVSCRVFVFTAAPPARLFQ